MDDTTPVSGTRKALLVLLVGFAVLGGSSALYQRFVKPRADVAPLLTFEFDPASPSAAGDLDVIIKVNPNNTSFNAFELYFTYPDDKVEFRNTTDLAANIDSAYSLITKTVDVASKTVSITGVRTGSTFTGLVPQEIARVTMKVKPSITGTAAFAWKPETKLGAELTVSKMDGSFTLGTAESGARIYFVTAKNSYQKGENVDVDVMLDARTHILKSFDLSVTYATYEDVLTFQNEANLNSNFVINPALQLDPVSSVGVEPSTKRIYASLVAKSVNLTPTPITGTAIKLGTVKLKVKNTAPDRSVNFVLDASSTAYNLQTQNVLTEKPTYTIAIGTAATPTAVSATVTPTPTQASGTGVPFSFKLKFQGIATKPRDIYNLMSVKLVLRDNAGHEVSKTADFKANDAGIWEGATTIDTSSLTGNATILVKGPKHIQKRVCVSTPDEGSDPGSYRCSGNGTIALSASNTFDFSKVTLFTGDLPEQNGIVNSGDLAKIRSNLGKSEENILKTADVNLDGVVNTQDFALVIEALEIRPDE